MNLSDSISSLRLLCVPYLVIALRIYSNLNKIFSFGRFVVQKYHRFIGAKSGEVILAFKPLCHFLSGMENGDPPNIPILFYKVMDSRKLILWEIQEEYIRTRFKAQFFLPLPLQKKPFSFLLSAFIRRRLRLLHTAHPESWGSRFLPAERHRSLLFLRIAFRPASRASDVAR